MQELLDLAIYAAKYAGKEILKHYEDYKIYTKKDNSPLTTADIAANDIIIKILSQSKISICSEESVLEYEQRSQSYAFWLVDPLDGTKEFLAGNGEFCVCIALIQNARPILGVIHIPISNEIFYSTKGDFIYKNGQILKHKSIIPNTSNFIMGRHGHSKKREFLAKNFGYDMIRLGSAIKFCRMAELQAGIYLRLGDSSLWDIAAGDFLLTQSGGVIIDLKTKKPPRYDGKSLLNNHFLALSSDNKDKLAYILKYLDNTKNF